MTESEQEDWRITERYVAELKAGRQPRLEEYLVRYPGSASAIADFVAYYQAVELQLPEEDLAYHPPTLESRALFQRARQQARSPSEPLMSLLVAPQGTLTPAQLAHELDISEDIVMLLEQRVLAEATIPVHLVERLAFTLRRPEQEIRAYLRQPPPPPRRRGTTTNLRRIAEEAASYGPPQVSAQSFLWVLGESTLATMEQKQFWQEIVREEQT